jgi:predicted transcriptional regulator of viral defense system
MKVAEQIRNTIGRIPESQPFGYADLGIKAADFYSAAKALERLQKNGTIKKVSKGVFYIPRKTIFGELGPDSNEILNRYLFEDGKRVAYETGYSLYNRLGLTTQMAFKIKVATNKNPIKINIGSLQVSSVKSYVDITEKNYQLLGFLDALKDVKKIPDCSVIQAVRRMSFLIKDLSPNEQNEIIQYALFYPARVRALLGAILENLNLQLNLDELKNSLNPLTKIKLNINDTELPTIKNWNIE